MARIVKKLAEGTEYLLIAANAKPTTFTVGESLTQNAVVTINGNLIVLGTQTTINSTDTFIEDRIITLSSGLPLVANLQSGIEVARDGSFKPALVWDEPLQRWMISSDGITFANIATIGGGGSYLSSVIEDLSPQLGGSLDTNGQTISSVASNNVVIAPAVNLQVEKPIEFKEVAAITSSIPGYALLAANVTIGGGNTGMYVTHQASLNQELITKRKALIYSIILG